MKNKDFQKNVGWCLCVIFFGLFGTISFAVAGRIIYAVPFIVLLVLSVAMLHILRGNYNIYLSIKSFLASKSVREQILYIIGSQEAELMYMYYGTPEEFKRFKEYIDTMSADDVHFDRFKDFLAQAEKHNRLK